MLCVVYLIRNTLSKNTDSWPNVCLWRSKRWKRVMISKSELYMQLKKINECGLIMFTRWTWFLWKFGDVSSIPGSWSQIVVLWHPQTHLTIPARAPPCSQLLRSLCLDWFCLPWCVLSFPFLFLMFYFLIPISSSSLLSFLFPLCLFSFSN